jgi:CheY-like chemotaxis protein
MRSNAVLFGEQKQTVSGWAAVEQAMGRAYSGPRHVVLVVEDEYLIRANAVEMVEEAGFEAIAVCDADEAIRILEDRNDIRANVQMPGSIDGLRLAWVVSKRWPPVALIVTSGRLRISEADLPSGGRFLGKPYQSSELEAALHEVIA